MTELLRATGIHKHRGGRKILDDFNLVVARGERVVLSGTNGTGKSTLIALVVGLLIPERGSIVLNGAPLDRQRARALGAVGYAPDRLELPDPLRVDEWLALVASLRGTEPPDPASLTPLRISEIAPMPMRALSLGQKRRVALASALVGNPPLLVLDEPTNGLDAEAHAAVSRVLVEHAERGGGVLCATHDATFAEAMGTRTVRRME